MKILKIFIVLFLVISFSELKSDEINNVLKNKILKKFKFFLDHVLLLFDFEKKYFDKVGIPSTFVGHPLLEQETKTKLDITSIISNDKKIIFNLGFFIFS